MKTIDDAIIAQVRLDLILAIAETQAEIQRLEAWLADVRARETDEEPATTAAMAEGETEE